MTSLKLKKIIFWLFAALFFFLPLVFTPLNYELFEFNKMILVYLLTLLIIGAWLGRMILEKKVIFKKSVFFWPLSLFLFSQILSTVFSIDSHTSFWGYYSRFHGGLLSTFCYLSLFWALFSNGEKEWVVKLVNFSLFSAVLVAFYGILERFGIDKDLWVQDVQNRVFSTLGQPNWLAAYLSILLFLALGKLILEKENRIKTVINYGFIFLFYLCLLYTKSRSGFLGLAAGGAFFWLFIFLGRVKKKIRNIFFLSSGLFLLLSLVVGTPFSPSLFEVLKGELRAPQEEKGLAAPSLEDEPNITPSSQIRQIVWKGALDLWRKYPLLGTGVETFAYSYYWVRPVEHNLTSEWDFLYNKAHNEYLNLLANSGSLGLLAYFSILGSFFFWFCQRLKVTKKRKEKQEEKEKQIFLISSSAALISILVSNFFGFSVVVIGFWLFSLLALSLLLLEKEEEEKGKDSGPNTFQIWLGRFLGVILFYFLLQIIRYWQADYFLSKGIKAEQDGYYEESLGFLNRAVSLRPAEGLYYDRLSLTLADLAWVANQKGEKEAAEDWSKKAIEASSQALKLSPFQLNFYRDRAKMFFVLSQIDLNYLSEALETMLAAIELSPTDAKLYYNAGLMFASLGEKEKGQEYLQKAVELKPNYDQAKQFLEEKQVL